MGWRGAEILAPLYNRIIVENKQNRSWIINVTVPIWKGKGVSKCINYRPILLLWHTMKIYERILDGHLQPHQNHPKSMLSMLPVYFWRNTERKTRKSIWRF